MRAGTTELDQLPPSHAGAGKAALEQARRSIATAANIAPEHPEVYRDRSLVEEHLGLLQQQAGRLPKAEAAFQQVPRLPAELVKRWPGVLPYRADQAAVEANRAGLLLAVG